MSRNFITLARSPVVAPFALKNSFTPLSCLQLQSLSIPVRTVTKKSLQSAKRKSVKVALTRFYRLHWGGWIRTRCGRHKKMHKKSSNLRHRLRQHVLVNSTQATLLDNMVTKFWKRPKHYIDDIYDPYHRRTFLHAQIKPIPYPAEPLKKPMSYFEQAKLLD